MIGTTLSPQVFTLLAGLVEEYAGLHYTLADRELFEAKLLPQMQEAGFDAALDYYYFLRYDPARPAAIQRLIEALVVHESYFFREYDGLRALTDAVLLPAVRAGQTPRVWCTACATGEEPLSLAMELARAGILKNVSIVATDISNSVLDRAARGDFNRRSLRWVPPGFMGELMHQDGERITIAPEVRGAIDFRRVNLIEPTEVEKLGVFDAVVCRNVLIYFNDETAIKVIDGLVSSLRPGGRLLVGTAESLLRFGTELTCSEIAGAYFYSKVGP